MKSIKFLEDKGVNINASLEMFGDINVYNNKLGNFLVDVHTKIKQLIVFMQNGDIQNYRDCVLSMSSDAKIYGFDTLANLAQEHYDKAAAGDQYYINSHINDLISECNNAIIMIQEYLNGVEDPPIVKPDNTEGVYDSDTILVVDDSNIIRNFVEKIFNEKYNVGTAKNGEEAINILEANKDNNYIKAILLDLNMPKVDGFGVLEHMREKEYLNKIPVSIISGDSSKATIDRAFTYDIVDMLEKPFNTNSVKAVVEKTLMYNEEK